jgi:hypothetical protein
VVASLVSYGGCSGLLTFKKKKMVVVFLLCVILRMELLNKDCSGALLCHGSVFGLASLLKLVITVCQNSGLCEYPTYELTLLVSVASVHTPYFDPVVLM